MTKRELLIFRQGLNEAKFSHPRVTYAINKNKRMLQAVIEDMEKTIEPDEKFKEYQQKREELARKHADKDTEGNPKTKEVLLNNGERQMMYEIPGQEDPKSKFRTALAKLNKEYEEAMAQHNKKLLQYERELLNEKADFEPFMLPLDLLEAHEVVPQTVMDKIFYMIKEPENDPV